MMVLSVVVLTVLGIVSIVAQATGSPALESVWLDAVLRLGFPVVVVFMIVKGWLVPGFVYEREEARSEKIDARLVDLEASIREKFIPALLENTAALQDVVRLVDDLAPQIADTGRDRGREPGRRR